MTRSIKESVSNINDTIHEEVKAHGGLRTLGQEVFNDLHSKGQRVAATTVSKVRSFTKKSTAVDSARLRALEFENTLLKSLTKMQSDELKRRNDIINMMNTTSDDDNDEGKNGDRQ